MNKSLSFGCRVSLLLWVSCFGIDIVAGQDPAASVNVEAGAKSPPVTDVATPVAENPPAPAVTGDAAVTPNVVAGAPTVAGVETPVTAEPEIAAPPPEEPWDYSPYRVLVWIVADDPALGADALSKPLGEFLDRPFAAIWRTEYVDAPSAVASVARRSLADLDFNTISASDPVFAVKRNHLEAARIRGPLDLPRYVKNIKSTSSRAVELFSREPSGDPKTLSEIEPLVSKIDGDALELVKLWSDESVEALLLSRGMAMELKSPEAKIITPPVSGLVVESAKKYDKIFVVTIEAKSVSTRVQVVEFDTVMRIFGPVVEGVALDRDAVPASIGSAIIQAFAPMVRIEDAGQKNATGLVRANGLILDENSPAAISEGDVLVPTVRKDDRNGNPISIGPLTWAYLLVTEKAGAKVTMDFHAGLAGGLQGRNNKRTFRRALKTRPYYDQTIIRLHARGNSKNPLIGYEIYDKDLASGEMSFVGRTDWNGRLWMDPNPEAPLRLLYVKNGGAVLARLPVVPGQSELEVADLGNDDLRLKAEAYLRGVQNAIIDLIAVRELFAARIRLRMAKGELKEAEDLLYALREQPSNEKIAEDMGKKQTDFLKQLGSGNASQKKKIDEMFSTTRELLSKHINPKLIRDLETEFIAAQKGGGAPKASPPPPATAPASAP